MKCIAIIPVFNEVGAVAAAVTAAPSELCEGVIVVDGGSSDGTAAAAQAAGATVVRETRRGYGQAITSGVAAARALGAEAYVIYDGNGSVAAADLRRVVEPLARGEAELVIGWRAGHHLRPLQRLGNRLAVEAIARAHHTRFFDVGSIRAIRAEAYASLALDDLGYGWPLQLLARAAAQKLRVLQPEITPLPRIGRSKVSGTVRGSLGASAAFVRVLVGECLAPKFR